MSVLIETSSGDIVIDLLIDYAPKLCENFLKLCKIKYYNFAPIHSVQKNFSFQTGDPLGPLSADSDGGTSIWGMVSGDKAKKSFPALFHPKLKHVERGTVSMATAPLPSDPDTRVAASQFIVTLGDDTDYLDGKAAIFGKVVEGFDVLDKINTAITDERGNPLVDIRINHTIILDDPYPDPAGLHEEEVDRRRREQAARANALTLELMGDLPFAEVKPPRTYFSFASSTRKSGDSLQYAFIEYEVKSACEAAYSKMQDVLIDDRRIHVDFSQSVSKLSEAWRQDETQKRRSRARGGYGGAAELEKRRQYRDEYDDEDYSKYGMVYSQEEMKTRHDRGGQRQRDHPSRGDDPNQRRRSKSRSRSPQYRRSNDRHPNPRARDRDRNADDRRQHRGGDREWDHNRDRDRQRDYRPQDDRRRERDHGRRDRR
ncbi:unnamed protein product [Parascedosporium putredinis]|uniref:Peptidyl-prolyl cis-trans isomerase n=1 Tax=Parascedosporium putredinis TaxID=1442378 RepID=A0A9P1M8D8_9PEZI|nr:unnamed protein product [Parascedosporium putredinis]CAI7989956.1 unnamed protein product [Parascedosporium putredinis]